MAADRGATRKLQRGKRGDYSVSIPAALVAAFGWKAGDVLAWRVLGPGKLKLVKPPGRKPEGGDDDADDV